MNENIKWDASNPVRFTHIVFDGEIHKLDNMIKANELRIGNWVLAEGNPYKIKHISPDDEWEPIELSPEILEKAGLSFVYDAYSIGNYVEFCKAKDGCYYVMFEGQINNPDNPIKYVHQLQNLVHSLTGTELEINLK